MAGHLYVDRGQPATYRHCCNGGFGFTKGYYRKKKSQLKAQGKIERWHRSMKNVVKLQNYYAPSELERAIAEWVEYYNNQRYHESLENVTPADVYIGREKEIINKRDKLKEQILALRR